MAPTNGFSGIAGIRRQCQRAEIKRQRIALMNRQLLRREGFFEPRNYVAVDLDGVQVAQALCHRAGECAQARADFGHQVMRLWIDRADDGVNHPRVSQKMLAEAFARSVCAVRQNC